MRKTSMLAVVFALLVVGMTHVRADTDNSRKTLRTWEEAALGNRHPYAKVSLGATDAEFRFSDYNHIFYIHNLDAARLAAAAVAFGVKNTEAENAMLQRRVYQLWEGVFPHLAEVALFGLQDFRRETVFGGDEAWKEVWDQQVTKADWDSYQRHGSQPFAAYSPRMILKPLAANPQLAAKVRCLSLVARGFPWKHGVGMTYQQLYYELLAEIARDAPRHLYERLYQQHHSPAPEIRRDW